MHSSDTRPADSADERRFGELVFRTALPHAIHSLDDHELRALLIALLKEWRYRKLR
jgi:hypothetical protein